MFMKPFTLVALLAATMISSANAVKLNDSTAWRSAQDYYDHIKESMNQIDVAGGKYDNVTPSFDPNIKYQDITDKEINDLVEKLTS